MRNPLHAGPIQAFRTNFVIPAGVCLGMLWGIIGFVQEVSAQCLTVPTITITQPTCALATGTITVDAPQGADFTYSIDGLNYFASFTFSGLTPGNYNLTYQSSLGLCTYTPPVVVTINAHPAPPAVSAGAAFTKTCSSNINGAAIGETNDITATYLWSPVTGLSSSTVSNPTANPAATTTYTVTKTITATGCSAQASVIVTVNATAPAVSAGTAFTKTCSSNINGAAIGETNDITATYLWSPVTGLSSSTVSNPTANPAATTTYTVTKTITATGCSAQASVIVTVNATAPAVSAGTAFTKTCSSNINGAAIGETNDITATYLWSPVTGLSSSTVSNPTANPAATTTYTVTKTITASGCSAQASVIVTVNATVPAVSAGTAFTKTCSSNISGAAIGETNDITATYLWSPVTGLSSSTVSNPTANPAATTTYTVTKTITATGCSAQASVIVTVNATVPAVSAGTAFTKTCSSNISGAAIGETNDITATYLWSPLTGLSSSTVSNPTANPAATTTYTVTKTITATGCSAQASVIVTVNAAVPAVSAGTAFTKSCSLNINGASIGEANDATATYAWSPAAGLSSTTVSNPTANPAATTTYTVTKTTTATGCSAQASVIVTVNATVPTVSAGNAFTKTCSSNINGASIGEANDATATYAWSPAAGLSSTTVSNPTANPAATTTYSVTKTTTATGCSAQASVIVTVNATVPTVSAGNAFTKTCSSNINGAAIGETNDITATYLWSPVTGLSSSTVSNPTANPAATTTYTVTKTITATGCSAQASVIVTVNTATPTVITTNPAAVCSPGTVNLTVPAVTSGSTAGLTFSYWTNVGGTAALANPAAVNASGIYYIRGTTAGSCSAIQPVTVTINLLPAVMSTNPAVLCGPGSVSIGATASAGTINWYATLTGGTSIGLGTSFTTPSITTTTNYYVDATANGCTTATRTSVTATINVIPAAPTVGTITQPTCASAIGSVLLNGLPSGNWTINPGGITGSVASTTISSLAAGTYNYTVTNATGCTSIASANVVINARPPTPIVTPQTTSVLSGITFTFEPTGVPLGTTYTWTAPVYTGSVTGGSIQTIPQINISGTLTAPSGTGTAIYTVTPTSGSCSGAAFTLTVTVTSTCIPVGILTQPADNSMCSTSGNASFTVISTGTAPFAYQWQYNNGVSWTNVTNGTPAGAVYTNQTSATLGVTGITQAGVFQYRCNMTNCSGGNNIISNAANLTVNATPSAPVSGTITQPSCILATGSVILAGLPATGTWIINPGAIAGSGASTTISGLAAGTYNYTVTNAVGCISPPSASIVINAQPPTPIVGDQITSVVSGIPFTVTPAGVPAGTTYTWTAPVSTGGVTGGNAQTLPRTGISGTLTLPSGTGTVTYTVTPTSGSCVGATFTLTVTVTSTCVPVSTGTQPADNSMCSGSGNASFTFIAAGTAPFTYQWQYNNGGSWANVINGTPAGAVYTTQTTATMNVAGITAAGIFQYRCAVTNCSGGNNLTSSPAALTVNATPSAPALDIITQPTCSIATGSVILTGLPAGNWTVNPGAITGTGTSTTISGLATGTYNYAVTTAAGCTSPASASVVINAQPVMPVITNQTVSVLTGIAFTVTPSGVPAGTTYTWTVPVYTGGVTGGNAQATGQTTISGTLTIPAGTGTATYTITPASGSCVGATFTLTVTVTSTCVPVSIGTQPADNSMCSGSGNASFTIIAAGTAPFTYQWQFNNGGSWANVINGTPAGAVYTTQTTATMNVAGITAAGIFQYRCAVTNCSGGNNLNSSPAVLTVNGAPSAPTAGTVTQPTCLIGTGSVILNGLPATGSWTVNPGAKTGAGSSTTISGLTTGTYNFTVANASGCTSSSSANIIINAAAGSPTAPIIGAVVQPTCQVNTGSIAITAPTGTGITYSLDGLVYTNSNGIFTQVPPGTYTVTAKSAAGCISPGTIVTINAIPSCVQLIARNDDATTFIGTAVTINILANDYNPGHSQLTLSFCQPLNDHVIINADSTITYIPPSGFSGTDSLCYTICNPCSDAKVYIHVLPTDNPDNMKIYNALTPNGDGSNDKWIIGGIENFPDNEVQVFNRWGDLVFNGTHYNNKDVAWDGTYWQNKMLPDGTYYYIIKIKGMKTYAGWIYLRDVR